MPVSPDALTDLPPLDYAAIRAEVRTGDIALCSGTQFFSRVIRWGTASPWSHVAMIFRLEDLNRVMVLEAVEKIGVRAVPLSRFVAEDSARHRPYPGDIVIARHEAFDAHAADGGLGRLGDFATDRLGAPFDVLEMTRVMMRIALGGLGVRLPKMLRSDGEFICSEYVARCLEQIGIEIPWDGRGFIGPANFADDPRIHAVARVSNRPFPGGTASPVDRSAQPPPR